MQTRLYKTHEGLPALTLAILLVSLILPISSAWSATGCIVSRDEIEKQLANGVDPAALTKQYDGCVAADNPPAAALEPLLGPGFVITNTGNVDYEAITSCGYHPQRKELTCPVQIRRRFGYGGFPALQPAGSFEFVLFCANFGAGWIPINTSGVHVHDEPFGVNPPWQQTVVIADNQNLFDEFLTGQTLRARAILSFGMPPAGCGFAPVFGNQADFRIKLDP